MSQREIQLQELEMEIMEYHAMIDHFVLLNDREEIAYWRRALQRAKIYKRRLKNS